MGKIICLLGKSATGKDTLYRRLLEDGTLGLQKMVPYTTRPIRDGEQDGREYFYTDEAGYQYLKSQGKVIEDRAYHTIHGLWRYFTVDDGQFGETGGNFILIGTLEAYRKLQDHFGRDRLVPVLVELEDGTRLQRALDRERGQDHPRYEEMCRRFLADSQDFAEERIREAGITRRFRNDDLEQCLAGIRQYILACCRVESIIPQQ